MDSIALAPAPAADDASDRREAMTPRRVLASMPAESPLAMPIQSLTRFDRKSRRKPVDASPNWQTFFSRIIVFGGGLALFAAQFLTWLF